MSAPRLATIRRGAGAIALCAALAVASSVASHAAFVHLSSSAGNSFEVGTVEVGDNDTGVAVLTLADAAPGATDTGCLHVTYEGTLPADLRLHATVSGSLAPHLTLTVTRGSDDAPAFGSCDTFVADTTDYLGLGAGVVFQGPLSTYPTTAASGIADPPVGDPELWTTGESHDYRLSISLGSDPAARGLSATAEFAWEARSA